MQRQRRLERDGRRHIYPWGGGVSGNGTGANGGAGGLNGGGSSHPSAIDILDFSNSGDTGAIVSLFTGGTAGGSEEAQSQTITLDAAAIGLTSGGTVTLTITGRGVDYNSTAGADADGKVTFTVPAIVTGTEVTVTLVVKTADGAVLFAGSKTQVLEGDASSLSISLSRQYWAMPASISAAASPAEIAYNPTSVDSDSVTFSIVGLSGAPAGVAYSWTDESGAVVGTGATLTQTVSQMLGGSVPASERLEKAYSVAVSYTDASGESKTLTASAMTTVVTTTTLTLTGSGGSGIRTMDGRMVLAVPKGGGAVGLHADVLCFGGTPSYGWSVSGSVVTLAAGTSEQDKSLSVGTSGGMATVTVTADLGDRVLTRELDVYVLDAAIVCGDIPSGGTAAVITDAATDSTVMTASLSGIASLPGASYEWQVGDMAVALTDGAVTSVGEAATITPAAPGNTTVTLTASFLGVSSTSSLPLKVAGLKLYLTPGGAAAGDVVMTLSDTSGVTRYASVVYGSGSETLAWNITEGSSVSIPGGATGGSLTITPAAGGKSVVTVSTNVNGRPLSKELTVYVFDIALSSSATINPSTEFVDAWYPAPDITMTTADTAGVEVTASLNGTGMPEVEYVWMTSGTDPTVELTGTGASCTVKPKAAGMTTIKVYVKYGGSNVAYKNLHITVAGITLTGSSDTLVFSSDPTAANTLPLTATLAGIGPAGIVGGITGISFESDDTLIATVAADTNTATSRDAIATAHKGGKVTIKAKATIAESGKELTATKDITVLRPRVTYGNGTDVPAGTALPATGNINLASGPATLTAEFEGLTEDVSFAWACAPATLGGITNIDISAASGDSTTVSGSSGTATVKLTASYDGTAYYTKDIGFEAIYSFALANLRTGLASILGTSADKPVKIKLTAPLSSTADITTLRNALGANSTVFVDLSEVTIADGVDTVDLSYRSNLVVPPELPNTVTTLNLYGMGITDVSALSLPTRLQKLYLGSMPDLTSLSGLTLPSSLTYLNLSGNTNLTSLAGVTLPSNLQELYLAGCGVAGNLSTLTIPDSVTKLSLAGDTLTSLTGLRLPASLTYAGFKSTFDRFFQKCNNLTDLTGLSTLTMPTGITTMAEWFSECDGFTNLNGVTIPAGVTSLNNCFQSCKGLVDAGGLTIPSSVTSMYACFRNCTSLTTAPVIPSSVTPGVASNYSTLQDLFSGCTNLSGTITINATTSINSHWSGAFDGVDPNKITKIKVPDTPTRNTLLAKYPAFTGKVFIPGEDGY